MWNGVGMRACCSGGGGGGRSKVRWIYVSSIFLSSLFAPSFNSTRPFAVSWGNGIMACSWLFVFGFDFFWHGHRLQSAIHET